MSAADEVAALAAEAERMARDGAVGGITVLCWAARLRNIAREVARAENTADQLYQTAMEEEEEAARRDTARFNAIARGEVVALERHRRATGTGRAA